MKRGFKKWAETKAVEFRKELKKQNYEKLTAEELAYHLKVLLIKPNEIPGLAEKDKSILLNYDHWSAITIKNYLDEHVVIYNPTHSKKRQESDLMHELAHIICEHKMEKIIIREGFPFPLRDYNTVQEDEAIWLGGCLQIPREALVKCIYKGMNKAELAQHFGASREMLQYRMNVTGVQHQIKRYKRN